MHGCSQKRLLPATVKSFFGCLLSGVEKVRREENVLLDFSQMISFFSDFLEEGKTVASLVDSECTSVLFAHL